RSGVGDGAALVVVAMFGAVEEQLHAGGGGDPSQVVPLGVQVAGGFVQTEGVVAAGQAFAQPDLGAADVEDVAVADTDDLRKAGAVNDLAGPEPRAQGDVVAPLEDGRQRGQAHFVVAAAGEG